MSSTTPRVKVAFERREFVPDSALLATVLDLKETPLGTDYLYTERLEAVELTWLPSSGLEARVTGSWAGRLFGGQCEVRWRLNHSTGLHTVWRVLEGSGTDCLEARTRRYYLRGEVAKQEVAKQEVAKQEVAKQEVAKQEVVTSGAVLSPDGRRRFHDPGLRDGLFFPVDASASVGQRAWIEVREYLRPAPSTWPLLEEDVRAVLNTPRLVGHRFAGVHCDKGEE